MENKNKYLWILTLVGLSLGSTFTSYGQNETIVIKEQKEIRVEPIRIYGSANLGMAHNIMQDYPAKTDFSPSLITMGKKGKDLVNILTFDASVKLGFETKFYVEEKITKAVLEFTADTDHVKLSKLFFETGRWSAGLKANNFCNIAAFAPAKVVLLGWHREFNTNFTVGISVEQGKKYEFYPADQKNDIDNSTLKPRQDMPAASASLQYKLADKFGCIEVSGLARPLGIYNTVTGNTQLEMGYGVNIGTKLNVVRKADKLTFNVVFGDAIGNYISDLKEMGQIEENTAYLRKTNSGLEVKTLRSLGAHGIFEHRWNPALRATISGGMTTILNGEENYLPRAKSYFMGVYATGKLMYFPTKRTGLGVEYSWGMRTNLDKKTTQQANHLKALAEFKF